MTNSMMVGEARKASNGVVYGLVAAVSAISLVIIVTLVVALHRGPVSVSERGSDARVIPRVDMSGRSSYPDGLQPQSQVGPQAPFHRQMHQETGQQAAPQQAGRQATPQPARRATPRSPDYSSRSAGGAPASVPRNQGGGDDVSLLMWQQFRCEGAETYSLSMHGMVKQERTELADRTDYAYTPQALAYHHSGGRPLAFAFVSGARSYRLQRDRASGKLGFSAPAKLREFLDQLSTGLRPRAVPGRWSEAVPLFRVGGQDSVMTHFKSSLVGTSAGPCVLVEFTSEQYGVPLQIGGLAASAKLRGFVLFDRARTTIYHAAFNMTGEVSEAGRKSRFDFLTYLASARTGVAEPVIRLDVSPELVRLASQYVLQDVGQGGRQPEWMAPLWVDAQTAMFSCSVLAEQRTNPIVTTAIAAAFVLDGIYTLGGNIVHDVVAIANHEPGAAFNPLDDDVKSPLKEYVIKPLTTIGAQAAADFGLISQSKVEGYATIGSEAIHLVGGIASGNVFQSHVVHGARQLWGLSAHLTGKKKAAAILLGKALYYGRKIPGRIGNIKTIWENMSNRGLVKSIRDVLPAQPSGPAGLAVCLVVDTSGSMSSARKLPAAKAAAEQFMQMLRLDQSNELAMVSFTSTSQLRLPLTSCAGIASSDISNVVSSMKANGNTEIDVGLQAGLQTLRGARPGAQRVVLLLSDGKDSNGLGKVLGDLTAENVTVYTVAYGKDADRDMLRNIASTTGGESFFADTDSIKAILDRIRSTIVGESVVLDLREIIAPGALHSFEFNIPAEAKEATVQLDWPGSHLILRLIDPTGRIFDIGSNSTPTVQFVDDRARSLGYCRISDPTPGRWLVEVFADDVPVAGEFYRLTAAVADGVRSFLDLDRPRYYAPGQEVVAKLSLGAGFTVQGAVLYYPEQGGAVGELRMTPSQSTGGDRTVWEARFRAPEEVGLYELHVEFTATDHAGKTLHRVLRATLFVGSSSEVSSAAHVIWGRQQDSPLWPWIVAAFFLVSLLAAGIGALFSGRSQSVVSANRDHVYLGRDPRCGFNTPDDPHMSRFHARITWDGSQLLFENLSAQGSVLNGNRVLVGKVPVGQGSRIDMGNSSFILTCSGPGVSGVRLQPIQSTVPGSSPSF